MLTREQEEILGDALTPLFQYLEQEVIKDVARRINKTMTFTRTAELQAMELRELGFSPIEIRKKAMELIRADKALQKEIAKNTLEYKKEIKELIEQIVNEALENGDELMASAGEMSWIDDLRVWESNGVELTDKSFLGTLVDGAKAQTATNLLNISATTGFRTMKGWESVERLYTDELNKAIIKITSGTFSADKAVRDTIHDLAKSGLRTIDFASGRSMQIDTAVRLAVRTGAHQLSGQIRTQNINNTDTNLVWVEEHENARNKGVGVENHEQWQGKVYYVKGSPEDFREEAERIKQDAITDLWEATGYSVDGAHENNPLGLYGYNCMHSISPWFIGASTIPKRVAKRPSVVWNGKELDGYAQTQQMRRMERDIRDLKREKEALKALGQDTSEIDVLISRKTRTYKEFLGICNAPQTTARLRVESGTSDLTKTKAWRDYTNLEKTQ